MGYGGVYTRAVMDVDEKILISIVFLPPKLVSSNSKLCDLETSDARAYFNLSLKFLSLLDCLKGAQIVRCLRQSLQWSGRGWEIIPEEYALYFFKQRQPPTTVPFRPLLHTTATRHDTHTSSPRWAKTLPSHWCSGRTPMAECSGQKGGNGSGNDPMTP